ncbi:MAG: hypothetical protein H6721_09090 [Sandaracinus sp.]|nr:hypothetical protein [Sandaracinus sp.]MCB9632271.1 hypothetical protein [Sandaracinus sp.]
MTALTLGHSRAMRAGPWLSLFVLVSTVHVGFARAQTVDEARAAYEDARFEAALEALDRTFEASRLSVRQVADALELRALAAFALQDREVHDLALRQLAALQPNRVLAAETPPDVRARWEELRTTVEPFDARFEVRREGDDVIAIVIANDVEGLARTYELTLEGGGQRTTSEGLRARVRSPEGGSYSLVVTAIGPGGAMLAERRHVAEVMPSGALTVAAPAPNRRARRALISVSVVVVVAMAVGVGLSFALREDSSGAVLVGPQP